MKKILLPLAAMLFIFGQAYSKPTEDMPFGTIGDKELDSLQAYAKGKGIDLIGDMKLAYKKDEKALARVFAFSLNFTKLVDSQPSPVKQRVRDFIFYPFVQILKEDEKGFRKELPLLFPSDYVFAKDDPIFRKS